MYKSWFNAQCRITEFELAYSKWLKKWGHIHTACYILLGKSKLEKHIKLPLLKYILGVFFLRMVSTHCIENNYEKFLIYLYVKILFFSITSSSYRNLWIHCCIGGWFNSWQVFGDFKAAYTPAYTCKYRLLDNGIDLYIDKAMYLSNRTYQLTDWDQKIT